MPDNTLTPDCLHKIGGAQLFMSPTWTPDQKGVKVQVVDDFALELGWMSLGNCDAVGSPV